VAGRPTASVIRWWTGRDNTHHTEKSWRVESAPFSRLNLTRRVHAVWGGSRW